MEESGHLEESTSARGARLQIFDWELFIRHHKNQKRHPLLA
jgi:hypothetical protein